MTHALKPPSPHHFILIALISLAAWILLVAALGGCAHAPAPAQVVTTVGYKVMWDPNLDKDGVWACFFQPDHQPADTILCADFDRSVQIRDEVRAEKAQKATPTAKGNQL